MWINKAVYYISMPLGLLIFPVALITMNVGGILIGCLNIFGALILMVLSLPWLVIYGICLGLSSLYRAAPWLSVVIGIIGIPVAVIGDLYTQLMPSMGEHEQKWLKQSICESFPYSTDFLEMYKCLRGAWIPEPGLAFSFDHFDLDEALDESAITRDQHERWTRVLGLEILSQWPGPRRADQG